MHGRSLESFPSLVFGITPYASPSDRRARYIVPVLKDYSVQMIWHHHEFFDLCRCKMFGDCDPALSHYFSKRAQLNARVVYLAKNILAARRTNRQKISARLRIIRARYPNRTPVFFVAHLPFTNRSDPSRMRIPSPVGARYIVPSSLGNQSYLAPGDPLGNQTVSAVFFSRFASWRRLG